MRPAAFARFHSPTLPAELLGSVVAGSARLDSDRVADAAIALLEVAPEDAILELGCGSGRMLSRLAARTRRGRVVGVDPSELMVRHARHRNRRWIESGVAEVLPGRSADLGAFAERSFDKVIAVHVVCFWTAPQEDLAELRRILRPGGRLVLGFQPEGPGRAPDPSRVPAPRVGAWLREAGFRSVATGLRPETGQALAWTSAHR
jgi:SAM-dependent methyltransferase